MQQSLTSILGDKPPPQVLRGFVKKLSSLNRTLNEHLDKPTVEQTTQKIVVQFVEVRPVTIRFPLSDPSEACRKLVESNLSAALRNRLGAEIADVSESLLQLGPAAKEPLEGLRRQLTPTPGSSSQ